MERQGGVRNSNFTLRPQARQTQSLQKTLTSLLYLFIYVPSLSFECFYGLNLRNEYLSFDLNDLFGSVGGYLGDIQFKYFKHDNFSLKDYSLGGHFFQLGSGFPNLSQD